MSPGLPHGSCTGSPASSLCLIPCAGGSGHGSSPTSLGPGSVTAIGRGRSLVAGFPSSKLANKTPWCLLARWPALLDAVPEQGTSQCHPPRRQGTRGVVRAGPPFCQSPYFGARAALPALRQRDRGGLLLTFPPPAASLGSRPPFPYPRDTLHPRVTTLAAAQPLSPSAPTFPLPAAEPGPAPAFPWPLGSSSERRNAALQPGVSLS